MPTRLLSYIDVSWQALKRLYQDQFTYRAAALAFTTLLAIVPLLSVIVYFVTLFPVFNHFATLAQNYIVANFIPDSGTLIQKYLFTFTHQASRLPTLGIIFLLSTVITLVVLVEHTLNAVWTTHRRKKSIGILLLYWLILLFTPILIGMSVFLSSYLFSMSWFFGTTNMLGITLPMLASVPLLINTTLFSALYIVVPNAKVSIPNGIIGGLVASLLFEAAKKGFAFYIKHFPSYELIYGTMATIPIFLIWVYISWLIILYGALVTQGISKIK